MLAASGVALAADDFRVPGVTITFDEAGGGEEIATAVKIVLLLTVLSLAPAILIAMTSFTRIIIVLAILRHALGMPETPPNTVLISLALFLTLFTMTPVVHEIYQRAIEPYAAGELSNESVLKTAAAPLKDSMVR